MPGLPAFSWDSALIAEGAIQSKKLNEKENQINGSKILSYDDNSINSKPTDKGG